MSELLLHFMEYRAAVYLSLMGPKGMKELGQLILQNALYAQKRMASLPGVRLKFRSTNFKEFVVDFSAAGKSVAQINKALLEKGIFGGKDLTSEFPELKNCALYCVTDMHSKSDIDTLILL